MIRSLAVALLALALAVPLSGCGRRGAPIVPENSTYPRGYPYTPFPKQPKAETEADDLREIEPVPQTQPFKLDRPGAVK